MSMTIINVKFAVDWCRSFCLARTKIAFSCTYVVLLVTQGSVLPRLRVIHQQQLAARPHYK